MWQVREEPTLELWNSEIYSVEYDLHWKKKPEINLWINILSNKYC